MKRKLLMMLCCTLLVGLAACGDKQENNNASTVNEGTGSVAEATEKPVTEVESLPIESENAQENAGTDSVEQKIYSVKLIEMGDSIVKVIEAYRELTGLGLKEAKEAMAVYPCIILETEDEAEAQQMVTALTEAGAVVEANGFYVPEVTIENVLEENVEYVAEFAVDRVFQLTDYTAINGTVKQGTINVGDNVVIVLEDGSGIEAVIYQIEVFGGYLETAEEGKNVGLCFEGMAKDAVSTATTVKVKAD